LLSAPPHTAAWDSDRKVRFMLDYLHDNITKQLSPTNFTDTGAKFDTVVVRRQVTLIARGSVRVRLDHSFRATPALAAE